MVWTYKTMKAAVHSRQLSTVIWLREQIPPCPWNDEITDTAAENNDINMLSYLRSDAHIYDGNDERCAWCPSACARAAQAGNLEVNKIAPKLQYAHLIVFDLKLLSIFLIVPSVHAFL